MKTLVAVIDRFHPLVLQSLKTHPRFDVQVSSPNEIQNREQVEALLTRTKVKVDEQLMESLPQLKVIVTSTSGFDHIDVIAAKKRKIQVYFSPEGNVYSASELTLALALACIRKIPVAHNNVLKGNWNRDEVRGLELHGKTWGLVGLGRIGQRVAQLAKAFGCEVMAYDPYQGHEAFEKAGAQRSSLNEILRSADILSLHVPLTSETLHMINVKTLHEMNEGTILINTSRGDVVHEQDLCAALEKGDLKAVGLDVFHAEPLPLNSPLLKFPQVVLTPHVGGTTDEAYERSCQVAMNRLIAFFDKIEIPGGDPFQESWFIAQR